MADKYFQFFPIINYGNTNIIDITKRVSILESVSKNPYVFYPYEITHNERPDQLAHRYYRDPYKSWLIYLTNKIVDPYYEWYMHQNEFDEFISNKYGSYESAIDKIYYYRHKWESVENISVSGFAALTPRLQLFWEPEYTDRGNILSYRRKQMNWTINTNKIISLEVSNTSFVNNEICNIVFDINNTGTAQVMYVTGNTVYLQHTAGTTLSNDSVVITGSSYVYGRESQTNTAFSNTTLIVENIVDEEEIYWSPVTYYEYETEKNEFNKTVRVIDNNVTTDIVSNFRDLMK